MPDPAITAALLIEGARDRLQKCAQETKRGNYLVPAVDWKDVLHALALASQELRKLEE